MVNYKARRFQCLLLFWALAVSFDIRSNVDGAIRDMTERNDFSRIRTFDWSESEVKLILGSYEWLHFLLQMPVGWYTIKHGGKDMILKSLFGNSLLTLMTPALVAAGGWETFCAIRLLQGLLQGVVLPSVHSILAMWLPVEERATIGTLTYCGCIVGYIFSNAVTHSIGQWTGVGWPMAFYVPGVTGLLFCICWRQWGANHPRIYKYITVREMQVIIDSLENAGQEEWFEDKLPWKDIITSGPFLVLIFAQCSNQWGHATQKRIPHYLAVGMEMEHWKRPPWTAASYVAQLVVALICVALLAWGRCCKCFSLTGSRKFFNSVGMGVPMVTYILLSYCTLEQKVLAQVLMLISTGMNAACLLGFWINHIDLAPNFAGFLMGIANCAATLFAYFTNFVEWSILRDDTNLYQWQIIMFLTSSFYFWGNLWFFLFASAEIANWNSPLI